MSARWQWNIILPVTSPVLLLVVACLPNLANSTGLSGGRWLQLGEAMDVYDGSARPPLPVSLSADGSRIAIGAAWGAPGNGKVRVLEFDGTNWALLGGVIDAGRNGGSTVSLSSDGSRVASGSLDGDVSVLEFSSGAWTKVGLSTRPGVQVKSVSLSSDGSRVAIGGIADKWDNRGQTHVFELSNNKTWTLLGTVIKEEDWYGQSGYSVSLSSDGSRLAIGSPLYNNSLGRIHIYEFSDGKWAQLGQTIGGEATKDFSGSSVSLNSDGSRVAIGAMYARSKAGNARIFEFSSNMWTQLGQTIYGDAAEDESGKSVSLSSDGTRVGIGSPGNDGAGSRAGLTRIFELSAGVWTQFGNDIYGDESGDCAGLVSLSSDGSRVATGANFGQCRGNVRVFGWPTTTSTTSTTAFTTSTRATSTTSTTASTPRASVADQATLAHQYLFKGSFLLGVLPLGVVL